MIHIGPAASELLKVVRMSGDAMTAALIHYAGGSTISSPSKVLTRDRNLDVYRPLGKVWNLPHAPLDNWVDTAIPRLPQNLLHAQEQPGARPSNPCTSFAHPYDRHWVGSSDVGPHHER